MILTSTQAPQDLSDDDAKYPKRDFLQIRHVCHISGLKMTFKGTAIRGL